ncbi:MAG: TetR/AcrR family transcriptional regulator C-terminal domain-containing protein [Nocardioidaceae bacterium]
MAGLPAETCPRRPPGRPRTPQGVPARRLATAGGSLVTATLRSLHWVESFLAGLAREGFSDDAAVAAYRGFTSFLLGHLLLEVSTHGADVGPLDVLDDGSQELPALATYPHVAKMRQALSEDHAAAEFEESLENLLDRLQLLRLEETS